MAYLRDCLPWPPILKDAALWSIKDALFQGLYGVPQLMNMGANLNHCNHSPTAVTCRAWGSSSKPTSHRGILKSFLGTECGKPQMEERFTMDVAYVGLVLLYCTIRPPSIPYRNLPALKLTAKTPEHGPFERESSLVSLCHQLLRGELLFPSQRKFIFQPSIF